MSSDSLSPITSQSTGDASVVADLALTVILEHYPQRWSRVVPNNNTKAVLDARQPIHRRRICPRSGHDFFVTVPGSPANPTPSNNSIGHVCIFPARLSCTITSGTASNGILPSMLMRFVLLRQHRVVMSPRFTVGGRQMGT